jgi:3-oxosteroid 1-dehydrogenase
MRTGIAGRGRALVAGLMEANLNSGVEMVNNARVVGLTQSNGRVSGVEVQRNGRHATLMASKGVILASGGFEWNRSMWQGLIGVPFDGPMSPPYNEGDGLNAAARVGAQLGNINQVWWMPSIQIPGETYDGQPRMRSAANRGLPGSIIVNRSGRRYGNESMNYNDFGKLQVAFDPHAYDFVNAPSFQIFDQGHMDRYPLLDSDDEPPVESLVRCASTLRELASQIGVDPEGLEAQVGEFNRYAEQGRDPQFHRGEAGWERKVYAWERFKADDPYGPSNPTLAPICQPPFYAYELKIGCFGTKGGVVIDECGQVLNFENQVIPGLYAAGNVTAGVFGPAYPGGGSTLGPAVVFGYIAGRAISA